MSNSSIWPIERTLLGATTPSQSGSGSDDKEEVLHIPHNVTSVVYLVRANPSYYKVNCQWLDFSNHIY